MNTITYTHALNNLHATMDKVVSDHEPVIVTRRNGGSVVMMSLEDFQSWVRNGDEAVRGDARKMMHRTPTRRKDQGSGALYAAK